MSRYSTPVVHQSLSFPTPKNLESKSKFLARWAENDLVARKYGTPAKRAIAAERAWATAKAVSLVSMATSEGEFLLFGAL